MPNEMRSAAEVRNLLKILSHMTPEATGVIAALRWVLKQPVEAPGWIGDELLADLLEVTPAQPPDGGGASKES